MKKNIAQYITILVFLGIFGLVFGGEYWWFQSERKQQIEYNILSQEHAQAFTPSTLQAIEDAELHSTPDLGLLEYLVQGIDAATDKILVEVYIFTEKDLRDALLRAHARGVEVKVLLENNPYMAPYLNDKHYQSFQEAGIDVRWSDPLSYSLNHSKLLIIDERAFISTGNFSYSLFKYNRDFLVEIHDMNITESLEELFYNDFYHKNIWVLHPNIVLSPEYSREKIEWLVSSAQRSIDMYFPYISDTAFEEFLFEIAAQWVTIQLVVEEDFYDENPDVISRFTEKDIIVTALKGDSLHGKAVLVDESILYIGSINFSTYSFDENRELWIILREKNVIEDFKEIFLSDL